MKKYAFRDGFNARYHDHRGNAKNRGILFLLTFDEWKMLWVESGKWSKRGPRRGQYVMARFGDQGAYELGNVRICPQEENHREVPGELTRHLGPANPAYGKNYWIGAPASRHEAVSRKLKGRPKPEHMRVALSATATGRKRVVREGRATWAYSGEVDFPSTV